MQAVAVICEYNPFHTGHEYCISQARGKCDCDTAIGVMSGFFVQRGEPALIAPQLRAQAAVQCGLDAVIQLPTVFSCAAGSVFAEGAVNIISKIRGVRYIAMGVCACGEILTKIAELQCSGERSFTARLKEDLDCGLPYATALTNATAEALNAHISVTELKKVLKEPNNVLAIEYIKAILKSGCDIKPIFIKRKGNGYNDVSALGEYISATAARELIKNGDFDWAAKYIPQPFMSALENEYRAHYVDESVLSALTVNALRTCDLSLLPDCGEGLDFKLKRAAERYYDFTDVINNCKSKRYTMSRIKRLCLQALLGITNQVTACASYAAGKLIAIKADRKDIIKNMPYIAVKNTDYAALSELTAKAAVPDSNAGSIYNLITRRGGNGFWSQRLNIIQ